MPLARPKLTSYPTSSQLSTVPASMTQGGKSVQLRSDVIRPLLALVQGARDAGYNAPLLQVVSGYRDPQKQQALWANALARYGSEAEARKWVAKPGGSAHEYGIAIDFNMGISNDSSNVAAQRNLPVWKWLNLNAEKYGFAPYSAEPWHWEYAGGGFGQFGGVDGKKVAFLALMAAALAGYWYLEYGKKGRRGWGGGVLVLPW